MPSFSFLHDQAHLGVHLQIDWTIEDVDPLALERSGEGDVVLLVELRLQLDDRRDLLAVLSGLDQRFDDGGVLVDAVQGDLDGQDVRVGRCLLSQLTTGAKES